MQRLRDIMTTDVEVVRPGDNLRTVAEKMRNVDTGFIPVCDGNKIQGTITDRDIVVRGLADGRDLHTALASEIMTPNTIYAYEDDSIQHASKLMRENKVRRLIVVDRDKNLVGVVSLGDLALETGKRRLAGQTLEEVSERRGWRGFLGRRGRRFGPESGLEPGLRSEPGMSRGKVLMPSLLVGLFGGMASYLLFQRRQRRGHLEYGYRQSYPAGEAGYSGDESTLIRRVS